MKKEEEKNKNKKNKLKLDIKKEKRLQYYSGWNEKDEPVDKERIEKQTKL